MPDKQKPKRQSRIKVDNLEKKGKELTNDEQKKVMCGGARNPAGTVVSVGSDFIEK